jgi:hypothetical protein
MHQMLGDVQDCLLLQIFGHPLIFWLVPVWEAVQVQKKGVLFYLGRVPSYFFFLLPRFFIGR